VIALGERPKWVAFDPDLSVVGEVKLEAPEDMLQRQLEHGTNASIRWRAAEALARRDTVPAIAALEKALGNEDEVWMVRAEAARALGQIRGAACFKVLVQYRRTAHPKVRRAVVAALGNFRSPEALSALLPLMEDESYLVESEACRSTGRTRQQEAFDHLLAALGRNSWADVVRAGALDGLAELRNEAALETVMHNTRYGVPTRGRRAAIMALARLSDSRRVREHLEGLLDDADPHVRIDVVAALQSLGDPRCRPELRRRLDRELDGRVARRIREALREIGALGQSENKRLRDDLEALKNDLTELKVRLSKMEGGSKVKHAKPNGSKADRGSQSRKKAKTKKKTRARASKATAVKRTTLRSRASNERRPHPR
jgi:aminopeptidase N